MTRKLWLIGGLLAVILLMGGCQAKPPHPTPMPLDPDRADFLLPDLAELKAGEVRSLDVTLDTRKDGPGEVSYQIFRVDREYGGVKLPMPEGMAVNIEPSSFIAESERIYHSALTLETTVELTPGEYWLRLVADFENVCHHEGWVKILVKP